MSFLITQQFVSMRLPVIRSPDMPEILMVYPQLIHTALPVESKPSHPIRQARTPQAANRSQHAISPNCRCDREMHSVNGAQAVLIFSFFLRMVMRSHTIVSNARNL
jgi:hypothetical protein